MSILDFIYYKYEKAMHIYPFAPSMFSESSIGDDISIFEDFNILQIEINKTDLK